MGSFFVSATTFVAAMAFGAWALWHTARQRCRPGKSQIRYFASYSLATGTDLCALPVLVVEVRNQSPKPLHLTLKRCFTFWSWLHANLAPERVGRPELVWAPLDQESSWAVASGERRYVLLGLRLAPFPSSLQRVEVDWSDTRFHHRRLPSAQSVSWHDTSGADTWGSHVRLPAA